MHTFATILQVVTALAVVILMAVQTDKAEQGGVMGIGAAGGRSSSEVNMAVGAERILKPLTRWMAVGFLFASILAAVEDITIFHFLGIVVLYVVVMMFGNLVWRRFVGVRS